MSTATCPPQPKLDDALVILDVGHGNSAVLLDSGRVTIFDAGPGAVLLDFLRENSITHIDAVVLSHADYDHIAGLTALMASGTVTIGLVRANTDSIKGSKAWDDLAFELSANHTIDFEPVLTVNSSKQFSTPQVEVEVAAPSTYLAAKGPGSTDRKGRALDTNSLSAVIRLKHQGNAFALLPGDIDLVGLENLFEDGRDIRSSIMVFPHHGGRPGQGDLAEFVRRLLALVGPTVILFSIGRGRFDTPRPELIAEIRRNLPSVRIACSQLSEHCSLTTPSSFNHLSSVTARGKANGSCCAGTVIYHFRQARFEPSWSEHEKFVSITANPLCKR